MLNLKWNRDAAYNSGCFNASVQTDRYKQRRETKGVVCIPADGRCCHIWSAPSVRGEGAGQPRSPAPHAGGSDPARPPPGPPRPARTAAAAARTAFLFSDTFLGTGFTFSLLTTPCGSAGDLLVPETVRCVHLTQNINSEFVTYHHLFSPDRRMVSVKKPFLI